MSTRPPDDAAQLPDQESPVGTVAPASVLRRAAVAYSLTIGLSLSLAWGFVQASFHPQISSDFLFVYLGIVSAVAISAWSTYLQTSRKGDWPFLLLITIVMCFAAILALIAALAYPKATSSLLDFSLSFLLIGLIWILIQSLAHAATSKWSGP